MAAIQHLPFGFTKTVLESPPTSSSSSSCQSMGRTLFYPALNSHSLEDVHKANLNLFHPTPQPPSKKPQVVLQQLRETIAGCKDFMHELVEVCNSGMHVSQCLASSFREMTPPSENGCDQPSGCCLLPQDIIKTFSDTWHQLAVVTQTVIASLEQMPFAILQDSMAKLEIQQNASFSLTSPSDEGKKILLASLLAIVHLQYQFSVSVCESFGDLIKVDPCDFGFNHDVNKPSYENGTKTLSSDVDFNNEIITSIQKHFSSIATGIHGSQLKHGGDYLINSGTATHVNGIKPDVGTAKSRAHRGWPRSSSLDSGTANIETETKTWSLPCLPPSLGLNSDSLMDPTAALWHENSSLESLWSFSAQTRDLPCKCRNGGFASNNDLQAVVSLLSYHAADRSSPTASYPQVSSSGSSGSNTDGYVWAAEDKTVTTIKKRSILKKSEGRAKPSGTWPRGGDLSDCIWGNYPNAQEASFPEKVDNFEDNSILARSVMAAQNDLSTLPEYLRRMPLMSNDQYSHLKATKSISWPAVDHPPESQPSDSNSSSDHDEVSSTHVTEGNGAFFMGLDLVGNDLMASVRQRRHSSGSMFPDISGNASCSSIRTKSIDSITVEERSRHLIWKNGAANCARNGKIEEGTPVLGFENVLWSSEPPQGLPPSGADNRGKPKLVRKYSLFGHAAC